MRPGHSPFFFSSAPIINTAVESGTSKSPGPSFRWGLGIAGTKLGEFFDGHSISFLLSEIGYHCSLVQCQGNDKKMLGKINLEGQIRIGMLSIIHGCIGREGWNAGASRLLSSASYHYSLMKGQEEIHNDIICLLRRLSSRKIRAVFW